MYGIDPSSSKMTWLKNDTTQFDMILHTIKLVGSDILNRSDIDVQLQSDIIVQSDSLVKNGMIV